MKKEIELYSFILSQNTIVVMSKKEIQDVHTLVLKSGEQTIKLNYLSYISEIVDSEHYNRYELETVENLDIKKIYTIKINGVDNVLDIAQYFKTKEFENLYTYSDVLGCLYTREKTTFVAWLPTATAAKVNIYEDGDKGEVVESFCMLEHINGTYICELNGDYKNKYYTYEVTIHGQTAEATDLYANAVGVNGKRALITSFEKINTTEYNRVESITDAIIYEAHVRDISMNQNSGVDEDKKGKFLGLVQLGTTNSYAQYTALEHIKELGATHIHLLPVFDYGSIDESTLERNEFNWGYDPLNYNALEGSYSTNPFDANVRVNEFSEMIEKFHANGIGVIMDVVYNHTYSIDDSNHNKLVPKYYHRTDALGRFTDGSACGNEIASERSMVRRHIVDSVVHFAKDFGIDGFRFDLMGLHDIDTMNQIRIKLDEIDKNIIMYGEGWTADETPLPQPKRALKANASKLSARIAMFSDDIRDGIKGDVSVGSSVGFANGCKNVEDVKFGIVGSVKHKQVNIDKVKHSNNFWAVAPTQTITYCSAHDNLSLWDKLKETNKDATDDELLRINKICAGIVMLSQGTPFFQAGEEFGRTKFGNENSYKSDDSINMINWDLKHTNVELFRYYRGLIELRKFDKGFRLTTAKGVRKNVEFLQCDENFISYAVKASNKKYKQYVVAINPSKEQQSIEINKDGDVLVNQDSAGIEVIQNIKYGDIIIEAQSIMVIGLHKELTDEEKEKMKKMGVIAGVAAASATALLGIGLTVGIKKIKNKKNKEK